MNNISVKHNSTRQSLTSYWCSADHDRRLAVALLKQQLRGHWAGLFRTSWFSHSWRSTCFLREQENISQLHHLSLFCCTRLPSPDRQTSSQTPTVCSFSLTASPYFKSLSSAEASFVWVCHMIDCAKIGERSALRGGARPLSPRFYLPPPLGSLCGGESCLTLIKTLRVYVCGSFLWREMSERVLTLAWEWSAGKYCLKQKRERERGGGRGREGGRERISRKLLVLQLSSGDYSEREQISFNF